MELLPDFGTYLIDNQLDKPFIIRIFNDFVLGQDLVLGWAITGSTNQFSFSSIDNNPVPKYTSLVFSLFTLVVVLKLELTKFVLV